MESPTNPSMGRLKRSKSVFSLAQDFFKMRLDVASEVTIPGPQSLYLRPGSWNLFGSLRGKWNDTNTRSQIAQSQKQLDICIYEDSPSTSRKSLSGLFTTVGKVHSARRSRTGRTTQHNVLRKRSAAESNLQSPKDPDTHSFEHTNPVYPSAGHKDELPVTKAHNKTAINDENVERSSHIDSNIDINASYTSESHYQVCTSVPGLQTNQKIKTRLIGNINILTESLYHGNKENKDLVEQSCLYGPVGGSTKTALGTNTISFTSPSPEPSVRCRPNSSRSTTESLESPDYNKILSGSDNVTKIDIDPYFILRVQALEQRYKNLSIQRQSIQESIRKTAAIMSQNLHHSAGCWIQSSFSSDRSDTVVSGYPPQDSWINSNFLWPISEINASKWMIDGIQASQNKREVLGDVVKKDKTPSVKEYHIHDKRGSGSVNLSPAVQSRIHKAIPPSPLPLKSKKRSAMRSTTRNSSVGPFHIKFPTTEFREGHIKTYKSKSDAIGDIFQNVVEYSNYTLFDRGSKTFYPQAKDFIFRPTDEQFGHPKLEWFWLPMQFGPANEMSSSEELGYYRCAVDQQLSDETDVGLMPFASTSHVGDEERQCGLRTSSINSLLDLYFNNSDNEQPMPEPNMLKQTVLTPANTDTVLPDAFDNLIRAPARLPTVERVGAVHISTSMANW